MGILIREGHVINPATGLDEVLDVRIEDGKVKEMAKICRATRRMNALMHRAAMCFRALSICMCICGIRD